MTKRARWWIWNAASMPVTVIAPHSAAWALDRNGVIGGDSSAATRAGTPSPAKLIAPAGVMLRSATLPRVRATNPRSPQWTTAVSSAHRSSENCKRLAKGRSSGMTAAASCAVRR